MIPVRKVAFWIGSITALLSLVGLYICLLIAEVFPKAVYNLWGIFGGSYSPVGAALNFTELYILCVLAFAAGVGTAFWAYNPERKGKKHEKID